MDADILAKVMQGGPTFFYSLLFKAKEFPAFFDLSKKSVSQPLSKLF
jgi:hypothetical protein